MRGRPSTMELKHWDKESVSAWARQYEQMRDADMDSGTDRTQAAQNARNFVKQRVGWWIDDEGGRAAIDEHLDRLRGKFAEAKGFFAGEESRLAGMAQEIEMLDWMVDNAALGGALVVSIPTLTYRLLSFGGAKAAAFAAGLKEGPRVLVKMDSGNPGVALFAARWTKEGLCAALSAAKQVSAAYATSVALTIVNEILHKIEIFSPRQSARGWAEVISGESVDHAMKRASSELTEKAQRVEAQLARQIELLETHKKFLDDADKEAQAVVDSFA
jgi:hypothetical protein